MSIIDSLGMLIARKWIAGVDLGHAMREAKKYNSKKENVIMNYLGEDLKSKKLVEQNKGQILALLDRMHSEKIKGSIAVKPTQIGIAISKSYFAANYSEILEKASVYGFTVWLDMEQFEYVKGTIETYLRFCRKYDTGICIQAKLRQSLKDIQRIVKQNGRIRLVKGAYKYTNAISFQEKQEVYSNYIKCMDYLFAHSKKFMIATHDERIINIARNKEKKTGKKIQFGMLKGIRPQLAAKLAESEDMNIYMPYGEQWLEYSMRRLSEWEHAKIILRSIMQG